MLHMSSYAHQQQNIVNQSNTLLLEPTSPINFILTLMYILQQINFFIESFFYNLTRTKK